MPCFLQVYYKSVMEDHHAAPLTSGHVTGVPSGGATLVTDQCENPSMTSASGNITDPTLHEGKATSERANLHWKRSLVYSNGLRKDTTICQGMNEKYK